MRASMRNSTGSAKHNDRAFDTEKAEHIDKERTELNRNFYCNRDEDTHDFTTHELKFYEKYFSKANECTNYNYKKNGHAERCTNIAGYYEKHPPLESIYQIGNMHGYPDEEILMQAFRKTLDEIRKWYPRFVPLDFSLHMDEQTPHIHLRAVILGEDKYGNLAPIKSKGYELMGIERPHPDEPAGKYNNAQMTFTDEVRQIWYRNIQELGLEIETQPKEDNQHLDTLEYKRREELKQLRNVRNEIKEANADLETAKQEKISVDSQIKEKQGQLTALDDEINKEVADDLPDFKVVEKGVVNKQKVVEVPIEWFKKLRSAFYYCQQHRMTLNTAVSIKHKKAEILEKAKEDGKLSVTDKWELAKLREFVKTAEIKKLYDKFLGIDRQKGSKQHKREDIIK